MAAVEMQPAEQARRMRACAARARPRRRRLVTTLPGDLDAVRKQDA
jgi:hypothetical protein